MHINTLKLKNYRNIINISMCFSDGINIIYGNNAEGKTNIIESLFLASTGRSHRTKVDKELIQFNEKYSNIKVTYNKNGFNDEIEVFLKRDEKKGIAVNRQPIKRIGELFGQLHTVIFSPYDLCIINDSPSDRRRFMDIQICQVNKLYYYNLHTYFRVLKQRNALLKRRYNKDSLFAWDKQLVQHGMEIIKMRHWFIDSICTVAKEIHSSLTNGIEMLNVLYKPSVSADDFETKLLKSVEKDMLIGNTSIGPHKDDVMFYLNGQDAKLYGSQGQKRTVVLSLKIAEVDFVKNEIGDTPVLLLDDALSELDYDRQEMLLDYIIGIQAIITGTGMEDIITGLKDKAKYFYIKEGRINKDGECF